MQNAHHVPADGLGLFFRHALRHPLYWLVPTLLAGGLGLAFALVHQPNWVASQALTVREDNAEGNQYNGQFNEAERLKHAQETFLELSLSPPVIEAALRSAGPPAKCRQPDQWPTAEDVQATREDTSLSAPNGLEFGTTRLFYLSVANSDRQRALDLASAICDQSEQRFKKLRDQDLRDHIAELTSAVDLATGELQRQTSRLQEMEATAGSDLAELRMLSEAFAGASNLQTSLVEVRQELRQAESTRRANEQLLHLLTAAQEDPANLVATSNRLLEAQPALRRLKDGLIDAQLARSQLLGTMSDEHPRVRAAMVAEQEIRGHLHRELDVAVRGLRADQNLVESQIAALSDRAQDLQQRMETLAAMRATYSNQLAEVRQATVTLTTAQQELNSARASLAAGDVTSLVTRVEAPQIGPRPEGPGRSVIAGAGAAGGLLLGLGILVLTCPAPVRPAPLSAAPQAVAHQVPRAPSEQPSAPLTATTSAPGPQHAASQPAARPAGTNAGSTGGSRQPARAMTLKEALIRCSATNDVWKSNQRPS